MQKKCFNDIFAIYLYISNWKTTSWEHQNLSAIVESVSITSFYCNTKVLRNYIGNGNAATGY